MAIGYATGTRGGSHHDTRPTLQYDGEHDETTEGTPEFAARIQHFTALGNSLTQCRFVSKGGWGRPDQRELHRGAQLGDGVGPLHGGG